MKNRWLWEVVCAALLIALIFGVARWSESRCAKRVATIEQEMADMLSAERARTETTLQNLARSEAESVFRSFAAGIFPSILAGRTEAVDTSVGELIQIPGVVFAHVFDPSGGVLATSDRKLAATGRGGERSDWALAAKGFETRSSDLEGVFELAMPLDGSSGPAATLWLGWDLRLASTDLTPPTSPSSSTAPAPRPAPEESSPSASAP